MFEVVADWSDYCEKRTCPFRAVDPATGDVLIQGPLSELTAGLPDAGPGEVRVRFTAEQWAFLTRQ